MFEIFGKADNAEGVWVKHPSNQKVELRVRQMPLPVAREIEGRYGKEEPNPLGSGIPITRRTTAEIDQLRIDKGVWCWTDTRNFEVKLRDQEAVDFFSKWLLDSTLKLNDVVKVDGKLNDQIKRFFFEKFSSLILFVLSEADKAELKSAEKEAELSKT